MQNNEFLKINIQSNPHTHGGKPITNILFRKIRPVLGTLSSIDNFVSNKTCNFRLFVITEPLHKFNIVLMYSAQIS